MKIFDTSTDSLPEAWFKLGLVWLSTAFSRETLSYIALLLTISYTALLIATLIKKEWIKRSYPPTGPNS